MNAFEPKPFTFVRAPLLGTWMNAYFFGKDPSGNFFRVQFSEDAPIRLVSNVKPLLTAEQLDDELENETGCRFGKPKTCNHPDCKHSNQFSTTNFFKH